MLQKESSVKNVLFAILQGTIKDVIERKKNKNILMWNKKTQSKIFLFKLSLCGTVTNVNIIDE